MKTKVKAVIITGVFSVITAGVGLLSYNKGEVTGSNNTFNELENVVANVSGDNANITINDMDDFVKTYEKTLQINEEFKNLNGQLNEQLTQKISEVESLKKQLGDQKVLTFKNLSLSIDGTDKPINSKDAMVTIDGREYVSLEFAKKLIKEGELTIKDESASVGAIIKEKANLSSQWIMNQTHYVDSDRDVRDSYGNSRTNSIVFYSDGSSIMYSLKNEYSQLKCTISVGEKFSINHIATLTVKTDDTVVHTLDMTKITDPVLDLVIPINNCSLLTFEYSTNYGYECNGIIISDAIVYN